MRPSGEEEYQRFLGFPTSMWTRFWSGRVDLHRARHPLTWVRWRVAVHRRGPYTPDFEEFRSGSADSS